MNRDVITIVNKYPDLGYYDDEKHLFNLDRIERSFIATIPSKKLFLYHYIILQEISNIPNILDIYNKHYGMIPLSIKSNIIHKITLANNIQNWNDFYNFLNINKPQNNILANILRKNVYLSEYRKYHNIKKIDNNLSYFSPDRYHSNNNSKPPNRAINSNNWRL